MKALPAQRIFTQVLKVSGDQFGKLAHQRVSELSDFQVRGRSIRHSDEITLCENNESLLPADRSIKFPSYSNLVHPAYYARQQKGWRELLGMKHLCPSNQAARASHTVTDAETDEQYNLRVSDCVGKYELLAFEDVHADVLDLIPNKPGMLLDIGAGSGRDAAWFARAGWDVIAIDPAANMLESASRLHAEPQIRWLQDRLPGLEKTMRLGLQFDVLWLSAVWMHVAPADRSRAFRKMVSLLNPAGWIMLSLRHGSFSDGRKSYPVSSDELDKLALQHGLSVRRVCKSVDRFGRDNVNWEWVCLQLPDDGTQALPLLRHTILRDNKSSTYKLALLRILVRIADSAIGVAQDLGEDSVAIPLGLVALYWIRMFKPLVEAGIPQLPSNVKESGLGFVKDGFRNLKEYSPYDLRIGQRFSGGNAKYLLDALIDARNTIKDMPAHYIKYPNSSEQVFKASAVGRIRRSETFVLSSEFLWEFGELRIPRHIWFAMCRFSSWIEPTLVSEWIRLMQGYAEKYGSKLSYDELLSKLIWIEPERDTTMVRSITNRMLANNKPVYCVWSGKVLREGEIDIDHCFPFSAWPCGDLWNLMPATRSINQHQKADKLVSSITLQRAAERIFDWWDRAYLASEGANSHMNERFMNEAKVSLPIDVSASMAPPFHILEGMLLKRVALKRDLQLLDWDF